MIIFHSLNQKKIMTSCHHYNVLKDSDKTNYQLNLNVDNPSPKEIERKQIKPTDELEPTLLIGLLN